MYKVERWVQHRCKPVIAVTSNTRGPRFEYSHGQTFNLEHLFTVNCKEKTKINKKRPGMAHF